MLGLAGPCRRGTKRQGDGYPSHQIAGVPSTHFVWFYLAVCAIQWAPIAVAVSYTVQGWAGYFGLLVIKRHGGDIGDMFGQWPSIYG